MENGFSMPPIKRFIGLKERGRNRLCSCISLVTFDQNKRPAGGVMSSRAGRATLRMRFRSELEAQSTVEWYEHCRQTQSQDC